MSVIFKGDSIYKSGGGGGGGYKDGGQLVDGDFIKVENNTISSYDNVSRDPVNFYFEVSDGEVISSIIELTTEVNATINIYVLKGGFYYLLGNIGGNSVNAGNDYKVNIVGDSYSIEQVSGGNTPILIINGNPYKIALLSEIGLAFTAENLNEEIGDYKAYGNNNSNRANGYGLLYQPLSILSSDQTPVPALSAIIPTGWRLPTSSDWGKVLNYYNDDSKWGKIRSDSGWGNTQGTNETGFNILPSGYSTGLPANNFWERGFEADIFSSTVSGGNIFYMQAQQNFSSSGIRPQSDWNDPYVSQRYMSIRLCKDI